MIDDTEMEAEFEKSPLQPEKWWLFGFLSPDSAPPLRLSRTHSHYIMEPDAVSNTGATMDKLKQ